MGVRPPSDSTDGDIQTFIVYMTVTTGSMFTWLIGLLCMFLYQVLYVQVLSVQIEHRDLSIYSQILSLLIYHSVTFSYIYIVHYIRLFILCKYVSHAT